MRALLPGWPTRGSLADQVAVVTGGGQGVGRAIALALGHAGATVVAVARTRSDVAEYAPWFPAAFERGSDIPPEEAGRLAVRLANLRDSRLSGRVFTVKTDVVDL